MRTSRCTHFATAAANILAAAFEQVDSILMEGFDPSSVDDILNLRSKGLRSIVLLSLGYRAPEATGL